MPERELTEIVEAIERFVESIIGPDRPMGEPPAGCRMDWLIWGDDA